MKKVRIIKNNKKYFESHYYKSYENKKIIEIDFNDLQDADLHCTDLYNADLSYADLYGANLSCAILCHANLSHTDLCNVDLCCANLSGAYLNNAGLHRANLCHADLHNATLQDSILHSADLNHANLQYADLSGANLQYAYLSCAFLCHANLSGANLQYADLSGAILDEEETIRKGKIINKKTFVYKKCQNKIVKLELQIGSIVFSINNKKCRTNKAKVISIDGNEEKGLQIASDYDNNFIYEVGKIVEVPNFNLMYNVECGTGIHFFWTEKEAKKYFS